MIFRTDDKQFEMRAQELTRFEKSLIRYNATYFTTDNDKYEDQRNACVLHGHLQVFRAVRALAPHEGQKGRKDDQSEEKALK